MAYNYQQEQTGLLYYVHEFTLALTVGNNAVRVAAAAAAAAATTKSRGITASTICRSLRRSEPILDH